MLSHSRRLLVRFLLQALGKLLFFAHVIGFRHVVGENLVLFFTCAMNSVKKPPLFQRIIRAQIRRRLRATQLSGLVVPSNHSIRVWCLLVRRVKVLIVVAQLAARVCLWRHGLLFYHWQGRKPLLGLCCLIALILRAWLWPRFQYRLLQLFLNLLGEIVYLLW